MPLHPRRGPRHGSSEPSLELDVRKGLQRLLDGLVRMSEVLELAREVGVIGRHVKVPVATEIAQDRSTSAMSTWPWPERLNAITLAWPVFLHSSASSMATRTACDVSGATRMPSVRANCTAASKQAI